MSTEKSSLLRRILRSPSAVLASAFLAVVVFVAAFGKVLAPQSPDATDVRNILAPPNGAHWLGTDSAGRDVLSRLLVATQNSLLAVALGVVVALVVGVVAGLIAGYFGGWFDQCASWVSNLIMALPGIVLLLAARSVLGPSVWMAMFIFGILIAPSFYRLVHVTVRGVRNELFVDAARVSGLSDARIIGRHVLGVVRGPIVIQTAIIFSICIAILGGLSLLGLVELSTPTWGSMLSDGFSQLFRQPWLLLWPSLTIAFSSLSLALLANLLRDELEGGGRPQTVSSSTSVATVAAPAPFDGVEHPLDAPIDALLKISDLVVGYPDGGGGWKQVVAGTSLTVGRGEVLGLVGESGSGKTQTAFAVLGLLSPGGRVLHGSVIFDGVELAGASSDAASQMRGRRISYIPQEPMSNLDPSFTIGSQLVEPLRVCLGLDKTQAKAKSLALLARVGIPDPERVFRSYPHELSGGMAQRVLIAGAVSCEPDLIIADEPTTALDVTVQAEILDLLRELQRETNTSLLLVTHNFGVVADLADRVAVMQSGRIVETGPVRAIFNDAQHPYTRSLLDSILDDHAPRGVYTEVAR